MGNNELQAKILRLEQENKVLKEEIRFHNKENSNLLAERNAAQIGYDEIREVRERYLSALEEIKSAIVEYLPKKQGDYNFSKSLNPVQYALLEYIQIQINEVLQCE